MNVAYALPVIEDAIPSTYREAEFNSKSEMRKESMLEVMYSLQKNDTWEMSELTKGKSPLVTSRCILRSKDLEMELLSATRPGW